MFYHSRRAFKNQEETPNVLFHGEYGEMGKIDVEYVFRLQALEEQNNYFFPGVNQGKRVECTTTSKASETERKRFTLAAILCLDHMIS